MPRKKMKISETERQDRLLGRALFVTYALPASLSLMCGEYGVAAVLGALALSVAVAGAGSCTSSSTCDERSWADISGK